MKILFHLPYGVVGGAELHIQYLLKNFSSGVSAAITYEHDAVAWFAASLGIQHTKVASPNQLIRTISEIRPDVIQFFHAPTMYKALKRLPEYYRGRLPKVIEILHNRHAFPGDATCYPKDRTDLAIAVSPDAAEHFERSSLQTPEQSLRTRVITIPNGIDTQTFRKVRRGALPKKEGVWPVGGYAGRMEAGDGKGIASLIKIVKDLPVKFEIVGRDMGGFAEQLAAQKIRNITLLPHTTDMMQHYGRWDFFVSRSPSEGFGLAIAEAIATGLPTITWECGGITHYLEHGKDALVVHSDTEMRQAILDVIAGKVKLSPTVDLSAETMTRRYEEVYADLLEEKPVEVKQAKAESKKIASRVTARASSVATDRSAILSVAPASWSGVLRAVETHATHHTYPETAVNYLRNRLRPGLVLLGGYTPEYQSIAKVAKEMGAKVAITWHGSHCLGEFHDSNRAALIEALYMVKNRLVDHFAVVHEGLAEAWGELCAQSLGVKVEYLPNVLGSDPLELMGAFIPPEKLRGLHLGVFGSGQPWKNFETQIVGASLVPEAKVHTQNIHFPHLLELFGIKCVKHPSLPQVEFQELVSRMTINLAVTFSETFSYFVADSLRLETPVVVSPMVPIFRKAPAILQKCICPEVDDPIKIRETVLRILDHYDAIRKAGHEFIMELDKSNKVVAKTVLEKWMSKTT